MTWYIFPNHKEDKLILLIIIATALLIRIIVYPHLTNPYWILFMDIGGPVIIVYLWIFSLVLFKEYYSEKYKELEQELKRLKNEQ